MIEYRARFAPGQLVTHRLFGYRGVIYDVDPEFQGSEEWYDRNAQSRPPREEPWYRVLVDSRLLETYVAEQNLELDDDPRPILHPLIEDFFDEFRDGKYVLRDRHN